MSLIVSYFENLHDLKIYDSARGITLNINDNPKMTSESLDALFESLSVVDRGVIDISGCQGVYGCDTTIAENKGWTVVINYSRPHELNRYTR
jgi:hypothetical protein